MFLHYTIRLNVYPVLVADGSVIDDVLKPILVVYVAVIVLVTLLSAGNVYVPASVSDDNVPLNPVSFVHLLNVYFVVTVLVAVSVVFACPFPL